MRLRPLVCGRIAARQCHLKIAPCHHLETQEAMTEAIVGPSWLRHGVEEEEEEVFVAKNKKKWSTIVLIRIGSSQHNRHSGQLTDPSCPALDFDAL